MNSSCPPVPITTCRFSGEGATAAAPSPGAGVGEEAAGAGAAPPQASSRRPTTNSASPDATARTGRWRRCMRLLLLLEGGRGAETGLVFLGDEAADALLDPGRIL